MVVTQHGAFSITTTDDDAAAANIQITADGTSELAGTTVTLDSSGNIVLSADGDAITMDDGQTNTRFQFNVDSTPELDVTGNFILDGSGTIDIDSVGETDIVVNGNSAVRASTNGAVLFNQASDIGSGYYDYGITNKKDTYHFSTYYNDFKQNYTILNFYLEQGSSEFEAYPT